MTELQNGVFVENGRAYKYTIYRGIRYVHALPVVVDDTPDTIGSCQAKPAPAKKARSRTSEH